MYSVKKKFRFEAAHQLDHAYSKCCSESIHGHSYVLIVELERVVLDSSCMVLDFGRLSEIVREEIVDKLDHALIIPASFSKGRIARIQEYNRKVVVWPTNPTAESMAQSFFITISKRLKV
ncbi:MAG: 6-pyruvoyl tetrahydropterin synthase family protein, partial [Smithella sp.]